jgi:predicted MFS family arabinose efflux permease
VNRLLRRFRQEPIAELPPRTPEVGRAYAQIFAPGLRIRTLKLTAVSVTYAMVAYYMLTWLPQMVADAGFAPATASLASAVNGAAGILGGVTLGVLAQRLGLARLTATAMGGVGAALVAFGFAPAVLPALLLAAGLCGGFMYAGVAGLYATLGSAYSAEARATGAGFVTGFGRLGSAAAPAVAGALFASGLGRAQVSLAFGALAVFSGVLFLWPARARADVMPLDPRTRRTERA